jgi:hypothetical protein
MYFSLEKNMNENDVLNSNKSKNSGWKKIGELNYLPNGNNGSVFSWLRIVFAPLKLSSRYLNEIIRTAKTASTRAAVEYADHDIFTHLAIYIPDGSISKGGTWGLFHMERIKMRDEDKNIVDHTIHFYLYMERE